MWKLQLLILWMLIKKVFTLNFWHQGFLFLPYANRLWLFTLRPWNTWRRGQQVLICWSCYSGWMNTDQARNPIWFDELLIWIVHPFVPHSSHSVSCRSFSCIDCSVVYSYWNFVLLTNRQHVYHTCDTWYSCLWWMNTSKARKPMEADGYWSCFLV